MANLTGVQSTLRTISGYRYRGYLSTPTETSVLTGTVSANASEPALKIAYTLDTGSTSNVRDNMEVLVYSSTGSLKGRVRVAPDATGNTLSNTNLPINEVSRGRIQIVSGDTFSVVRSWRLRDALVAANETFDKDSRIEYSAQNDDVPPLPNTGGMWVGDTDLQTYYGGIRHDATRSVQLSDSGVSLTYLHDVKDGTITSGTTTTGSIVATYPAGDRWIDTTVTDNGVSATKRTWVRVHDANDPPLSIIMRGVRGSRENGWAATFAVPVASQAALTSLPEGALVVYWEKEYYGGSLAAYGGEVEGRSHMKFVGYLQSETIRYSPDGDELLFDAMSPLAVLGGLTGFSQVLSESASPANWQEYKNLTIKRLIAYLVRWHTTLLDTFDLRLPFDDLGYPQYFVQQGIAGDQIREIAHAIRCHFTCNRYGVFKVNLNYQRATLTERAASFVQALALTGADIGEIDATWRHRYEVAQVEIKGFSAGGSPVPLKAVAPGEAPAEAPQITAVERMIFPAPSQTTANTVAGVIFAELNSLYNGTGVPRGQRMTMPPTYDVFDPADDEYFAVTFATDSDSPAARRSFSGDKYLLQEIEITHDADTGAKNIAWVIDHETYGAAGTTRLVESLDWGYVNPVTPQPPPAPAGALPGLRPGTGKIIIIDAGAHHGYTENFSVEDALGGPNWADSTLSVSGTMRDWVPDAYSPAYVDTGAAVNGWGITSTGIYRLTDLNSTSPGATLQETLPATASTAIIQTERGKKNWVIAVTHTTSDKYRMFYTTDGTNWDETTFATATGTSGTGAHACNIWMDPSGSGEAWIIAFNAAGVVKAWRTTDYGANASEFTSPDLTGGDRPSARIERPWRPDARGQVYWSRASISGFTAFYTLQKYTPGSGTADRSPIVSATKYAPSSLSARDIRVDDDDPNVVVMFGRNNNQSQVVGGFLSTDAAQTWTTILTPSLSNWGVYSGLAIVRQSLWAWGDGRIFYSTDRGVSGFDERTGDWGYTDAILNIAGAP